MKVQSMSDRFVIVLSLLTGIVILAFDLSMPLGVAASVPYILLVLIGLWSPRRRYMYLMAEVGTALTIAGFFLSPDGGLPWVVLANRGLAIGAIWITAFLGIRIKDSQAKLSAIVDTAKDAIITTNESGIIASANPAAVALFSYEEGELIGQNVSMLMPMEHKNGHDGYMQNYISAGDPAQLGVARELQGRRQDGSTFPLELSLGEWGQGNQHSFSGILRDISDRKEAEERTRQHQAELAHVYRLSALGEMASMIAHEINQPLTAISSFAAGCLRRLKADVVNVDELGPAIERISEQAKRASEIVQRGRAFARRDKPRQIKLDLIKVVERAVEFIQHEADSQEVTIGVSNITGICEAQADELQIQQVIINLLQNALDAFEEADSPTKEILIEINVQAEGLIELTVADSGPGLPEDFADHAFERFFTTKEKGLGLGLSICRSIIEAHGGQIAAESKPGQGTKFRITLPASTEEESNVS